MAMARLWYDNPDLGYPCSLVKLPKKFGRSPFVKGVSHSDGRPMLHLDYG